MKESILDFFCKFKDKGLFHLEDGKVRCTLPSKDLNGESMCPLNLLCSRIRPDIKLSNANLRAFSSFLGRSLNEVRAFTEACDNHITNPNITNMRIVLLRNLNL